MLNRDEYLNLLIKSRDLDIIKVITGIRRCGKSTLLEIYKDYLLNNGVDKKQIISMNFEDPAYFDIDSWKKLYDYINNSLLTNKKNYVFLDEIQNIEHFEKAVDGLYINKNVDIYITGSNSYLLSSELSTLLTGRYITIHMIPLSLPEFSLMRNIDVDIKAYNEYLMEGGFPYIKSLNKDYSLINNYLDGLYSSVVLKDIIKRNNIKETLIFDSLVKFLFDNIGQNVSTKKISDTLKSFGRKNSVNTIENYLDNIISSYLFYKVTRYDIKGKKYLKTGYKYYTCDVGLRKYILGDIKDRGSLLENIVFLELKKRGYEIYIGKINDYEIDFVVKNENGIKFIQVSESVRDEKTLNRELKGFKQMDNNYPKYLITLDEDSASHEGIIQISLFDFLKNQKDF